MVEGIMLQGTASNVGKSILATALCRIFAEDGYRVAPFKAWNMALNSYVTKDGGEVGRAQAVQAKAAGIEIDVDMQPLLVKPKGGGLSQIIVRGKPIGDRGLDRKTEEYIDWAVEIIDQSLTELGQNYQVLVMEGAGAAAEINIKDQDLANMRIAKLNQTPVLLVADVDRGGALASVVGTLKLLEPEERKLVKGIILNKFRGDYELLKPGLDILEEKTGKPVVGVIPYFKGFKIPDEDAVVLDRFDSEEAEIKIGVLKLPHISNFTDFDALAEEEEVMVDYITKNDELADYDALIIPGTKNTVADLLYLQEEGLAERITELAEQGMNIVGICGGYQILGTKLIDPELVEGTEEELPGLGLLDLETTFNQAKTTHQAEAVIESEVGFMANLASKEVTGYEIHMGQSKLGAEAVPFCRIEKRSQQEVEVIDGACNQSGSVWGTYLHGIFDNHHFRLSFINHLRQQKGLELLEVESDASQDKLEEGYQKLAAIVRENLDLDYIYQVLEEDGMLL
ncbi:cobyric acid synthase [Natroniella sulfidigena]|uniref:cobyric acid synthase n=1 Tax=Natroniella sulfidigena TaxID=723921 RepID=UPI00200B8A0C|nr:cobyric acid synthase [Natroniella sulfidigena]MCK8817375.1 cobyric acid synthase [Natroniella sulfidigena]